MSVYDLAHTLARAIKGSAEFREYKAAAEKVEANPQQKKMLQDLKEKQLEIQREHMMGQQISESKKKELQKLHEILAANPVLNAFFTTEYRFGRMMTDVQKIIVEDLEILPKK